MPDNTDSNLHRTIINGLLAISLENRFNLCAFRNLLRDAINHLNNDLAPLPYHNIYRGRAERRICLLQLFILYLDLRISCLPSLHL